MKGIDMLPAKLAFTVALGVAAAMAVGGGPALATHLSCGDTITADTTLDADLVDCPNHGIVIGADDITLDLNGHLIDGDGAPAVGCRPRREICDIGVFNEGHDGVTVRDGATRQFATGVFVVKTRHNRLLGISSSENEFFGFVLADTSLSVVRDSAGNDNPAPDGDGIGVFGSQHLRIVNNSFRRNSLGMHIEDSSDVLIRGNVFARNPGPAILMQGDRNHVRRNRCIRNHACIIVEPGSRNVIARNRLFRDREGIAIEKGRGNLVTGNVVVGVRTSGIHLGVEDPPLGSTNSVVRGNLVRGTGGDAFQVSTKDVHSLLVANIAIGAGDDGFNVRSTSARLEGNRALRNADLGIEAVSGVVGRGNIARGNGDPRQCTNVFCVPTLAALSDLSSE
jgi:parallel beta-helix repeat protein